MSVYIKGFPLPNNCGACPLRLAWCRERIYMVTRPESCPLIPVPDHGDLIDKSGVDVLSWTDGEYGTDFADGVLFVLDKLDELPVVIPAEGEDYEVPADLPVMYYPQVDGILGVGSPARADQIERIEK